MLMALLGFVAVVLTLAMFITKQRLLGFPSAIFWALLGGHAFNESAMTWDIYYFLGFASLMGMVPFCALGQYALREKRDELGEQEMEKGEGKFIDEGREQRNENESEDDVVRPLKGASTERKRKPNYGEFR